AEVQILCDEWIYRDGVDLMKISKAVALEKLRRQRDLIAGLPADASSPDFKKWQRDTEVAIANIFSKGGRHAGEFQRLGFPNPPVRASMPPSWWTECCRDAFAHAKVMLQSMVDEVKEYWTDSGATGENADASSSPGSRTNDANRAVFVVHGHDEAM